MNFGYNGRNKIPSYIRIKIKIYTNSKLGKL